MRLSVSIIITGLLFIFSCSPRTTVESYWSNDEYKNKNYDNLLVLAAMRSVSDNVKFESEVAEKIKKQGYNARAGYKVISPDTNMTKEQVAEKLQGNKTDMLIMFKLIGVDEDMEYNPPVTNYEPNYYYGPYYGYYDYYYPAYRVTTSEGYWTETEYYTIEVKMVDIDTEELVWTAKTQTANPDDFESLAKSVTDAVLGALKRSDRADNLK